MGVLFMIGAGAVLGWLCSIIMHTESSKGIWLDIGAGILGALLVGLIFNPVFGLAQFVGGTNSVGGLLLSLVGSVLMLVALNVFYRGKLR
ncbi:GlsB/YeaQ/YmgE family stress response membrane protein [Altericroceibacterium endophyticum]|nr:GlsB/YeaQ/YmgE family stress response membrane protein [Altericroceibacterium endophyticum]